MPLQRIHESSRIDRQLFGRCARQGEAGSAEALVCLQDELFARYAPALKRALAAALRGNTVHPRLTKLLVSLAQNKAERHNARIRLDTLKQDKKLQGMLAFAGDPN